jgi:hypothetical protein
MVQRAANLGIVLLKLFKTAGVAPPAPAARRQRGGAAEDSSDGAAAAASGGAAVAGGDGAAAAAGEGVATPAAERSVPATPAVTTPAASTPAAVARRGCCACWPRPAIRLRTPAARCDAPGVVRRARARRYCSRICSSHSR